MLVNITEYFIESGREWRVGENPDVPREVAARWIADGKATTDVDGVRDSQSPVSGDGGSSQYVVGIGNSIMANPDPARAGASWLEYAAIASGGAMKIYANRGISGNKSSDILARLSADALAAPAKWVVVSELTNDSIQNVPVGTARATTAQILDMIISAGKKPIYVAAPPKTGRDIVAYNNAARFACEARNVLFFNPWYSQTADGIFADTSWSIDGTHPTQKGQRAAGEALWAMMAPLFVGGHSSLGWTNADAQGLIQTNALFLTNTAGVPTGWTGAAGCAHSIEAGTGDVMGNWWVITATDITTTQTNYRSAIAIPASWQAGDRIRLQARVRTVGFEANGSSNNASAAGQAKLMAYIQLNWTGGPGGSILLREFGADVNGPYMIEGTYPGNGVTSAQILVTLVPTASSSGVLSVAQLQAVNLTLPGRV